jgi:hypothetical protein
MQCIIDVFELSVWCTITHWEIVANKKDLHVNVPAKKLLQNSKHLPDSEEDVTEYKAVVDSSLMHRCDVTNTLPRKHRGNLNLERD